MVNSERFRLEYKSEENNKLMNFAIKPFTFLDDEDLLECKLDGLWRALSTYDKEKSSFAYYLIKNVQWNCFKKIKDKNMAVPSGVVDKSVCVDFYGIEVRELVDKLDEESQHLVYQRFTEGLTYQQIGDENGYSRQTANNKMQKILRKLRRMIK